MTSYIPSPSKRQPLAGAALLVLLVLTWLCYQAGLGGPLLLDDVPQLQPALANLDIDNWRRFAPDFLLSASGPGGRPVAMATLIASAVVHGGDVAALKAENVLLHLLCGTVLLTWLLGLQSAARALLPPSAPAASAPQPWLPLLACALWLLHPLQVSTVLYTVQRMTLLSTLFVLCGLSLYLHGRRMQLQAAAQDQRARRLGTGMILATFALCLPLAALSKENGVLLIPLCAAQEWLLLRGAGRRPERLLVRALFGLLLALPLLLASTVLAPAIGGNLQRGFAVRPFTLGERLLTEPRVLLMYLDEWLRPLSSNLPFFHDDFSVSHGLLQPPGTALALLLLAGSLVLAWRARRRQPLCVLGWLVFLIGHGLEASVVPLELAFEHRNYLPTVGLALLLVALPWRDWSARLVQSSRLRATLPFTALLVLLLLAGLTTQRCFDWGDARRLYPLLFAANPDSPRLSALFADSFANAGQFADARQVLARQSTLGALLQRADIDCLERVPADPVRLQSLLAALAGVVSGYETEGLVHLANDALDQRCGLTLPWGLALIDRSLQLPITQSSSRQLLLIYRAHLHHALDKFAAAERDLTEAAAIDPGNPLPLLLSAEWWLARGDQAQARLRWQAARRAHGPHAVEQAPLLMNLGRRLGEALP